MTHREGNEGGGYLKKIGREARRGKIHQPTKKKQTAGLTWQRFADSSRSEVSQDQRTEPAANILSLSLPAYGQYLLFCFALK